MRSCRTSRSSACSTLRQPRVDVRAGDVGGVQEVVRGRAGGHRCRDWRPGGFERGRGCCRSAGLGALKGAGDCEVVWGAAAWRWIALTLDLVQRLAGSRPGQGRAEHPRPDCSRQGTRQQLLEAHGIRRLASRSRCCREGWFCCASRFLVGTASPEVQQPCSCAALGRGPPALEGAWDGWVSVWKGLLEELRTPATLRATMALWERQVAPTAVMVSHLCLRSRRPAPART